MMHFKSMQARLTMIFIGISLLTTLILGGNFIYNSVQENNRILGEFRKEMEENAEFQLKWQTQAALSIIETCYQAQLRGELSQQQAMRQAADLIRAMRYDDGRGYFTIDTENGVNVVLLGTAAEGKSRMDAKDPQGRYFIQEMIYQAKNGGGFTDLMFPKPGTTESLPKRYYTVAFTPYQWIIGTGIWIDRIDEQVELRKEVLNRNMKHQISQMIIVLIFLEAGFVLLAVFIGRRLAYPIRVATNRMRELGAGRLRMDEQAEKEMRLLFKREDEFGKMGWAMKEMSKNLYDNQQLVLHMAQKDALTKLANRRYFTDYIQSCSADMVFALISLDLDHFKEVNDTFGHQMGDAALMIFAEVLQNTFRNALNIRMGGDEFLIVIFVPTTPEEVETRLQSFMEQLIAVYRLDAGLKCLTVSAGIAYAEKCSIPVDVLMNCSDRALYEAKECGRSCYCVYREVK